MSKSKLGAVFSGLLSLLGCSSKDANSPRTTEIVATDVETESQADILGDLIPENPDSPFHFAFQMMHQPNAVLNRRIASIEEVADYVKRIESTSKEYFESIPEGEGRTCSIVFAIKPKRRSRFWIEYYPSSLQQDMHDALIDKLLAIEAPEVREGPVSMVMFALLWGGIGRDKHQNFSMVPNEWLEVGGGTIPDEPLSKVWPD